MLARSSGLRYAGAVCTLEAAWELTRSTGPAAVVIDKALGTASIIEWLQRMTESATASRTGVTAPVVWGTGITESEALRFLQAGARGVLRRTSDPETLLTCLLAVTSGVAWMEDGIFGETEKHLQPGRSRLTPREHEVAGLVEQGLRNRDIAENLGIRTGTVKIHLKHIFEKTGVRGRYGLALNGLREKGAISVSALN
ncbi:MAG TPA: response regulator transcription factor [Bryobacteraceae bacterium]|nr:response regulator transcription factor [Bryobacteraceae bacterium]